MSWNAERYSVVVGASVYDTTKRVAAYEPIFYLFIINPMELKKKLVEKKAFLAAAILFPA